MAFVHGKNTAVSVNGVDLSAFTKESSLPGPVDTHDVTTFGDDGHEYQAGLTDGSFTMSGDFDNGATDTPDANLPALRGAAAVTILFQPEGVGSGLSQRSFSAVCDGYDVESAADDMVTWSASFKVSGSVTLTDQV